MVVGIAERGAHDNAGTRRGAGAEARLVDPWESSYVGPNDHRYRCDLSSLKHLALYRHHHEKDDLGLARSRDGSGGCGHRCVPAQQSANKERKLAIAKQQRERDYELAHQHREDAALQEYLSQMANLLIDQDLLSMKVNGGHPQPHRVLARARTLSVLSRFGQLGHRGS
jgi:hypothetical protein